MRKILLSSSLLSLLMGVMGPATAANNATQLTVSLEKTDGRTATFMDSQGKRFSKRVNHPAESGLPTPSFLDIGTRALLRFQGEEVSEFFVLQKPSHLWMTVSMAIGSEHMPNKEELGFMAIGPRSYGLGGRAPFVAQGGSLLQEETTPSPPPQEPSAEEKFKMAARRINQAGCTAYVLDSGYIRTMNRGMIIVASGGFTSLKSAQLCQQKARQLGYGNTYIKQVW